MVHHAHLRDQRGLVVAAQVAAFPAVEPARLAVGHCGVDERRDEPTQGQLGIAGRLVGECRAVDQLLAQVEHRVAEQFVLARVVAVQRGSGDPHPLRDGLHADAVVAERAERLGRRAGDLRLAILRPAPDTLGAGGPGARHGQHHNGPSAYIAAHFDWKITRKLLAYARIAINIVEVLGALRRLLGFQVTIGELIVIALILGTPYLIVGVIWSSTHTEHLQHMAGADLVVSYLGSIVSWPVLLFADVCMT